MDGISVSSSYTWRNKGLVIYPESYYVHNQGSNLYPNKLRSSISCIVFIGPADSKRLISQNGAKVFLFKVPPISHPLSRITETPSSPWWHSSFWLCGESELEHNSPKESKGTASTSSPFQHGGALGWVLLNSVCQEPHFFWELSPLTLFTWLLWEPLY